jgi:dynein heavy chain
MLSLPCAWVQVTDAANEAKDNVKYLATLEKSLEPLFAGSVQDITDAVPALLSNVRMMYTIARYYSTPENMSRLFTKITNQVVRKCKQQIMAPGKLWDQDKRVLIANMKVGRRSWGVSHGSSLPAGMCWCLSLCMQLSVCV